MRPLPAFLIFSFAAVFAATPARADMTAYEKEKYLEWDFPKLIRDFERGVVKVRVRLLGEVDIAVGNGFYVTHSGIVATASHLLTSVAEPGMLIEVESRDGTIVRDPKLLGCTIGKIEVCFLDTGSAPVRWFRMDENAAYIDGMQGYVIGSTLLDSYRLTPVTIDKVQRQEFPKPHKMILGTEFEGELAGAPIIDMFGRLLGIVTSRPQVGVERVGGSAVGAQTVARLVSLLSDKPRESVADVKEKRGEAIRREALALRRLTRSQWKRLAEGKRANKKFFRYVDFQANGMKLAIPIPVQINAKSCRREAEAGGASLQCGSGRAVVRITVKKHKDHLRYLDRQPAGDPRVVDLIAKEMRAAPSYWDNRMRSLDPQIRDRLASNPGTWACREEAASPAPLLPRGYRCRAEETNFSQVGLSKARLLVQAPDLTSSVEFAAIGDGVFDKGLWSVVSFLSRGTTIAASGKESGRGIASVLTPAGRLPPTRNFCYMNKEFCSLEVPLEADLWRRLPDNVVYRYSEHYPYVYYYRHTGRYSYRNLYRNWKYYPHHYFRRYNDYDPDPTAYKYPPRYREPFLAYGFYDPARYRYRYYEHYPVGYHYYSYEGYPGVYRYNYKDEFPGLYHYRNTAYDRLPANDRLPASVPSR